MSDIVERLRKYAEDWRDRAASNDVVLEAAAHIDALREEVERLREVNKITREGKVCPCGWFTKEECHSRCQSGYGSPEKQQEANAAAIRKGE